MDRSPSRHINQPSENLLQRRARGGGVQGPRRHSGHDSARTRCRGARVPRVNRRGQCVSRVSRCRIISRPHSISPTPRWPLKLREYGGSLSTALQRSSGVSSRATLSLKHSTKERSRQTIKCEHRAVRGGLDRAFVVDPDPRGVIVCGVRLFAGERIARWVKHAHQLSGLRLPRNRCNVVSTCDAGTAATLACIAAAQCNRAVTFSMESRQ